MDIIRNIQDLVTNPRQYAEMVVDRLRNFNRGEKAVVSDQGAGMVPMTLEERAQQVTQGVLDNIGGGGAVGSIGKQKFFRGLFEPGGVMPKELRAGLTPEQIMKKYSLDDLDFRGTDRNIGIRYETDRPLFDRGVAHYDASGGPQAVEIMAGVGTGPRGGTASPAVLRKLMGASQLRIGNMKHIPEESVIYTPYDRWFGEWGSKKRPILDSGKFEFYPNELEGYPHPYPQELPILKSRDILNDPDLRKEYNMSLAVPADSKFHQLARILRDAK